LGGGLKNACPFLFLGTSSTEGVAMNLGIGVMVFFLSLIALVAEFILYFIFGMGAAFSNSGTTSVSSVAFFFVGLMLVTGTTGVFYPVCSVIGFITKNQKLGNKIFIGILALVILGYFVIFPAQLNKQNVNKNVNTAVSTNVSQAKPAGVNAGNTAKEEVKTSAIKEAVTMTLIDKSFVDADPMNGLYQSQITIKISLENHTDKNIKGIKEMLIFKDSFGDEILSSGFKYENEIPAHAKVVWDGAIDYNQFLDSHQKLRSAELKNLTLDWKPVTILFDDGTKLGE
jgi:hypothetical protein